MGEQGDVSVEAGDDLGGDDVGGHQGHPEPDNSLSASAKRATIAPNAMEIKRIISTFTYRIEPNPQGGFIAHASDPSLPPLEAPTREELQQKIQANIGAALAKEFPELKLPSGNQQVKFDFHIEANPGGGFSLHSHDPNATTIEGASHEEIEYPFAEKLAGVVGKYLVPELSQALANQGGSGDIQVFVDRKVSFTANPGPQKLTLDNAQNFQPSGTLQPGANRGDILDAENSSPITREAGTSWPIVRFFLALLVLAALMYFFRHH